MSSTPGATLDLPSSPDDDGDGTPGPATDGAIVDDGGVPPIAPVKEKRRDPLWAKLVIILGALLLLASGGVVATLKYGEHVANSSVNSVDVKAITQDANGNAKHATVTGAKNILLVGIDPRDNEGDGTATEAPSDGIRSDSIIVLHVNAAHDQAYLVSIPRDTKVTIPAKTGPGTRYGEKTGKINGSFQEGSAGLAGNAALQGGLELLAETLRSNYQLEFDAAAVVDFSGFEQVVDYIGGVDMYVDEDTTSIHIGINSKGQTVTPGMKQSADLMHVSRIPGVTPITYTKGWQHFAGWQALDFCRQRHVLANNDGDYGRQRHQQQFLKAVFKKIVNDYVNSPNPGKLTGVISKVAQTMTVADGGISLTDWVWAMKGIGTEGLTTMKTNGGVFDSTSNGTYELLNPTSLAMLDAVRNDTMGAFATEHTDYVASS